MKFRVILIFATAVMTLTSMSQCCNSLNESLDNLFNPEFYCPIKANINGTDYASEEYMDRANEWFWFATFKISSDVYYLHTGVREVQAASGQTMYVSFELDEEIKRSQLKLGERYRPKIYLSDYNYGHMPSTTEGWITIESYKENLECKFECVVRDTLTNEVIYDVKDGYFSLPYHGTP